MVFKKDEKCNRLAIVLKGILFEEQSLREIKEMECYGEGLFFKNGHYEEDVVSFTKTTLAVVDKLLLSKVIGKNIIVDFFLFF